MPEALMIGTPSWRRLPPSLSLPFHVSQRSPKRCAKGWRKRPARSFPPPSSSRPTKCSTSSPIFATRFADHQRPKEMRPFRRPFQTLRRQTLCLLIILFSLLSRTPAAALLAAQDDEDEVIHVNTDLVVL